VTVDGFPWLGGSISIFPPGSAKAQPSFERTFAVTTGDGLAISVEVIGGAGGGGAVDSVNGATGVVVLDADDIDDTSTTNKFATAAQLSAVDGLASTYQPLDADLTTLAAGNIPTNLNASLASQYATAAQGDLADTAVQPDDLATVATTGAYGDLSGTPTLGTAAAADTGDFATAAQGAKADAALPRVAAGASVENIGAVESNVQTVAATGATETLDTSVYGVFDMTMDQACEFTFSNPAPSGKATTFVLILRGAFTPTLPASVDWADASAPTYTTPSVYTFTTVDAGTTWLGAQVGKAFG
jgi:hypothetical protein